MILNREREKKSLTLKIYLNQNGFDIRSARVEEISDKVEINITFIAYAPGQRILPPIRFGSLLVKDIMVPVSFHFPQECTAFPFYQRASISAWYRPFCYFDIDLHFNSASDYFQFVADGKKFFPKDFSSLSIPFAWFYPEKEAGFSPCPDGHRFSDRVGIVI